MFLYSNTSKWRLVDELMFRFRCVGVGMYLKHNEQDDHTTWQGHQTHTSTLRESPDLIGQTEELSWLRWIKVHLFILHLLFILQVIILKVIFKVVIGHSVLKVIIKKENNQKRCTCKSCLIAQKKQIKPITNPSILFECINNKSLSLMSNALLLWAN